jgi:hypothetical protein
MKFIYDYQTFKGIALVNSSTSGAVLECHNFDTMPVSQEGEVKNYGFIRKCKKTEQLGDAIEGTFSLGLFLFTPTISEVAGRRYLQAFSDGTVRVLNPSDENPVWATIYTEPTVLGELPYDFEAYGDVAYFTNGFHPIQKWRIGWASSKTISDKGDTPEDVTGDFTWTLYSADVVVDSDVTGDLEIGDWLQGEENSVFYEISAISYDEEEEETTITLTEENLTYDGIKSACKKAPLSGLRARFITSFKDRMFYASGDMSGLPIVGILKCDVDTHTPLL